MNLHYFTEASLAIQIHLIAALAALLTGIWIWQARKGTIMHRYGGRVFAGLMIVTAISAIFIRQINNGSFSFIHLFVPLTFLGIIQAIYFVRKGDLRRHKNAVRGLFFGALLIPGLFAFLPGRLMWMMVFGG